MVKIEKIGKLHKLSLVLEDGYEYILTIRNETRDRYSYGRRVSYNEIRTIQQSNMVIHVNKNTHKLSIVKNRNGSDSWTIDMSNLEVRLEILGSVGKVSSIDFNGLLLLGNFNSVIEDIISTKLVKNKFSKHNFIHG